jgi:predicted HicB family RNase H-like nuclease
MNLKELMNLLKFEGYQGIITDISIETGIIHGEVLLTKDVVTFKADGFKNLVEEFKASVADYLEFCREEGDSPSKPLKGEVLVRCGSEIQAEIVKHVQSQKLSGEKITQNEWCKKALKNQLERERTEA